MPAGRRRKFGYMSLGCISIPRWPLAPRGWLVRLVLVGHDDVLASPPTRSRHSCSLGVPTTALSGPAGPR